MHACARVSESQREGLNGVCMSMFVCACACACIILLVCLYDCEHKKCIACRNWLTGPCDDATIKVSTVNTPV